jgi:hypothetical protein
MTGPTIHDLQERLDAELPAFTSALRAERECDWPQDDQGRAFFALEQLRAWVLGAGGEAAPQVWAAVERLLATEDPVLLNALAVGLLEGHWPRRQLDLMGPRTRALYDAL